MNGSFDGQVVMITGAAQGLGLAMAEAFLEEGAVVVGTDVNDTGLRAAARHQSGLEIHRMDVTRPGEIRQVVKAVEKRHGKIDVLVNNAGVNTLRHRVNVDKFPIQEWDRLIEVNLKGGISGCPGGFAWDVEEKKRSYHSDRVCPG